MSTFLSEATKLESGGTWSTRIFRLGYSLIAFEMLSGGILLIGNPGPGPAGFLVLAHLALGFALAVPCIQFTRRHLRYRRHIPSRVFDALGLLTALALVFSLLSGITLAFSGVSGRKLLWWLHIGVSTLGAIGVAAHLGLLIREVLRCLPGPRIPPFLSLVRRTSIFVATLTISALGAVWALGLTYDRPRSPAAGPVAIAPGNVFPADGMQQPLGRLARSRSCGTAGCHSEIYRQWKDSPHARTPNRYVDRVTESLLEETARGPATARRALLRECASCHAPNALLTGLLSEARLAALAPGNPALGSPEEHEGISCVLCHSISEVSLDSLTPSGQPRVRVAPASRLPFWESDTPLGALLHRTLIRAKPELHARTFTRPLHSQAEYCAGCHLAYQYESWHKGPYRDVARPDRQKTCQHCHMPPTADPEDSSGDAQGRVADHRFVANHVAMALTDGLDSQYQETLKFLRDEKVLLSVVAPAEIDARAPARFAVRVANVGVGHAFPAGPAGDLSQAWVEVAILDPAGRPLPISSPPQGKSRPYRMEMFDKDGRSLGFGRHRIWHSASDRFEQVPPLEYDEIFFEIPPVGIGRLKVEARLLYRKHNEEFTRWVSEQTNSVSPGVEIARATNEIVSATTSTRLSQARQDWEKALRRPPVWKGVSLRRMRPRP